MMPSLPLPMPTPMPTPISRPYPDPQLLNAYLSPNRGRNCLLGHCSSPEGGWMSQDEREGTQQPILAGHAS